MLVLRKVLPMSVWLAVATGACHSGSPSARAADSRRAAAADSAASGSAAVWIQAPDDSFRMNRPDPGPDPTWSAPVPERMRLSNGMQLRIVARHNVPIVVMQITSKVGADRQPVAGLGSFVGEMLEQGTTTRTALQISDAFEAIGAEHRAWVDWDSANMWVQATSDRFDQALTLVADVVRNPSFEPAEVERVRALRIARVAQRADSPENQLRDAVARLLYPGHVYGEPLIGTRDSVGKTTRDQLRAYWGMLFAPDRTTIVVVGDVARDDLRVKLDKAWSEWTPRAPPIPALRPPGVVQPGVWIIDRPGAQQSHIAFAAVGIPRTSPDHDALLLANAVFGGMGTSRINTNLRERHGWTYGARSEFDERHGAGPFTAGAAVDTPNTVGAIGELVTEFDGYIGKDGADEVELERARNWLTMTLPGRFESNAATAASIALLGVYGLAFDEFARLPQRIRSMPASSVHRAAHTYFDRKKMRLVVAGDRRRFESDLRARGHGPVSGVDSRATP